MIRKRFSHRRGIGNPPQLHIEEMSMELRTALWNVLHPTLFDEVARVLPGQIDQLWWRRRLQEVFQLLHWRISELTYAWPNEANRLEKWFFHESRQWHEIYDLVDFIPSLYEHPNDRAGLTQQLNRSLQTEGSPYRFIEGQLTLITDPSEIAALEDAMRAGDRFSGAHAHIIRSMQLLSQRPNPDFRNAIKEAISAVESTLKILTEKDHADLSEALKDFRSKHPIHGALMAGLDKLYGYTSNEHGLRHALLEAEANVGYAEAKFMLVACAAFMSYLIARTGE